MGRQLELSDIAMYLPYGLKRHCPSSNVLIHDYTSLDFSKSIIDGHNTYGWKPILRPLSDLIIAIDGKIHMQFMCRRFAYNEQYPKDWNFGERNGVYFASADDPIMTRLFEYNSKEKFFVLSNPRDRQTLNCKQYDLFNYLIENLFDINDLIGQGLAIDINNIQNVSRIPA